MTTVSATVIEDSVGSHSPRLTTIVTRYPRWIHAEGRTHRRVRLGEGLEFELRTPSPMEDPNLSRNASSSRAIPVTKMIQDVIDDPAIPLFWGKNQKGMQADEECNAPVPSYVPMQFMEKMGLQHKTLSREEAWLNARDWAVNAARGFHAAGYHKQLVNRLLEPFSHINVLWTGTKWTNFLALRDHEDAEPHIRLLAQAIRKALDGSTPKTLQPGEWHLPYVQKSDVLSTQHHYRQAAKDHRQNMIDTDLIRLSVARCASLSYRTVDDRLMGRDDAWRLYDKLLDAQPIHASPAEHQAQVDEMVDYWEQISQTSRKIGLNENLSGNLGPGWIQYRKTLPGEEVLA